MKKTRLYKLGIRTACVLSLACMLSACGTAADNSETEALRQEIADLQQTNAASAPEQPAAPADGTQTPPADTPAAPADNTQAPPADNAQPTPDSGSPADDTDTMESLTALVDDFTARVGTLLADSRNPELEQFFTYKQDAESIDRRLDRYEDELERQVRSGSLSRDDYRSTERELEKLEDALDKAEDQLEYYFGIDD